ncbi:MAG TPA: hypothetical protein PKM63_21780 [Panacibacter sp.]|nr:hypothetical protein [Panacibacter sp.]HNP46943.1 hypothetical protein [Panacibacter sp.]
MNLIITKHAYERGKERMGLAAGAFKKIAAQAYCYGVGMEETKGALNKHLQELATQKPDTYPAIYSEHVFVFSSNRLITVFRVKPNYLKLIKKRKES